MNEMEQERIDRFIAQSEYYKEEIIAANSDFSDFADALRKELEIMQFDKKFLPKKYVKGFKRTALYRLMEEKAIFEAFLDIEWDIKQAYIDDAAEISAQERLEGRMNFKG